MRAMTIFVIPFLSTGFSLADQAGFRSALKQCP
jgi:hypothetical protein